MHKSIYYIIINIYLLTSILYAQNLNTNSSYINDSNKIFDYKHSIWVNGGQIKGKVNIEKDKPVSNVCISVYNDKERSSSFGTSKTDKYGNYIISKLQTGDYYVFVDCSCEILNNYISLWWDNRNGSNDINKAVPVRIIAGQTISNINFTLNQGGIIFGKVLTQDGSPVPDICVAATGLCKNQWYSGNQTDMDGNYFIYGLASGNYYIHTNSFCGENPIFYKEKWWTSQNSTNDCNNADFVSLIQGQTIKGINIILDNPPGISGKITDIYDNPLSDVCVSAMDKCSIDSYGSSVTDKNGFYHISDILNKTIYLYANASCISPKKYVNKWFDGSSGISDCNAAKSLIISTDNNSINGINIKLAPGGIIRGRVFSGNNKGLSNVCIKAAEDNCFDSSSYIKYSDEIGNYFFVLPKGKYYISTQDSFDTSNNYIKKWYDGKKGTINCNNALSVNVQKSSEISNINIQIEKGGLISGNISAQLSQGIENICVLAYNTKCSDNYINKSTTDANGNFTLNIPKGKYFIKTDVSCNKQQFYVDLWWNSSGGSIQCTDAKEIIVEKEKKKSNINFELKKAGLISGYLKSSESKPLSNAIIYAAPEECTLKNSFNTKPDKTGKYQILVQEGQYYIFANIVEGSESYISKWFKTSYGTLNCKMAELVNVNSGKTIDNIDFSIEKGASVSGKVLNIHRNPIHDVCVYAVNKNNYPNELSTASARSDYSGKYKIYGIEEGAIQLTIDASCGIQRNYIDNWDSNGTIEHYITLTKGENKTNVNFYLMEGGSISGKIISGKNEPITGICVNASSLCGAAFYGMGKTNSNGNFLIAGIPEGKYYIHTNSTCDDSIKTYYDKWWNTDKGTLDCKKAESVNVVKGYTTEYINFKLIEDCVISGRVITNDNIPIPEVCVNLTSKCGDKWFGGGETDTEGYFSISSVEKGSYYLSTNASCINKQNYIDLWWDNNTGIPDCNYAKVISITPGNNQKGFDFILNKFEEPQKKQLNIALKDGYYQENIDGGIVTLNIKKSKIDLIVKRVSLEKVLRIISKRTGLRIILHGKFEELITFERKDIQLDDAILDLIKKRAGYIFIYSPKDFLSKIIIFSRNGDVSVYRSGQQELNDSPPEQFISSQMQEQELWQLLKNSNDIEKKIHALTGIIGRFSDEKAIELLALALNDQDEDVRMTSIAVMYDLKNNQLAVPIIARSLNNDRSPAVRALSAEALGEIGDKRAVRALTDALNDNDPGVKETAKIALEKISGPIKK